MLFLFFGDLDRRAWRVTIIRLFSVVVFSATFIDAHASNATQPTSAFSFFDFSAALTPVDVHPRLWGETTRN